MGLNYKLKTENYKLNEDGVAAIITVLFIAFLTSMVIALSSIILPRLRVSTEIKRSVGALYAADSALEWCLYLPKSPGLAGPVMQNGSTWTVSPSPAPPVNCSTAGAPAVKAVGVFQGTTRSLQASGF